MVGGDARQGGLADVEASQQRQGDDAPVGVSGQQGEYDPDVAVDVRRANRSRRGVVVEAGPFDFRPVALGGRVVDAQEQPVGPGSHRLEGRTGESGGHEVGMLGDGGDSGVGGSEVVSNAGGAQPRGDGASAGGENRAKEEADETRSGASVKEVGQLGKPLAGSGVGRA